MTILHRLSSQIGDRTEEANRDVADQCLADPSLLKEIADALRLSKDERLLGDCAEVMTKVAERNPGFVRRYGEILAGLLDHGTTRVRWEAMHSLSLIATQRADLMGKLLPHLKRAALTDDSTIVRDYAIDTLNTYATTGTAAAKQCFVILTLVLKKWDEKHAARTIRGLKNCVFSRPALKAGAVKLVAPYGDSRKMTIRKEVSSFLKFLGKT